MAKIHRTIVLPVKDNDGKNVDEAHRALQQVLLDVAGGYSIATQYGVWREPITNQLMGDTSSVYTVLTSTAQDDARIFDALARIRDLARQECVLTYVSIVDADFV
jgi:hypothetical protein